jgi:hypothetical protein
MDLSDVLDFQELLIEQIIAKPDIPLMIRNDTPPVEEVNPGNLPVVIYPVFSSEPVDDAITHLNIITLSLWRADDEGMMRLIVRDAVELEKLTLTDVRNLASTTVFYYVLGPGYGILRDDHVIIPELRGQKSSKRVVA